MARTRPGARSLAGAAAGLALASLLGAACLPRGAAAPEWRLSLAPSASGAPAPWRPANADVLVHTRDQRLDGSVEPGLAQHGQDCAPPPAVHMVDTAASAAFVCRDHLMTSLSSTEYGAVYITPDHLLDFSGGTATLRFDLSTARTSLRDWVDLWITPPGDNLALPLESDMPDGDGEPRNAVHVRMAEFVPQGQPAQTIFRASVVRDGVVQELPGNTWTGYESVLTPSAIERQTFELSLSRTHVRFGLPRYRLWWVDTELPTLGWDQGVVQLGHHSYNPTKDCAPSQLPPSSSGGALAAPADCTANTWHWANVRLAPARSFTTLHADGVLLSPDAPEATFAAPAPADAFLRFEAIGQHVEVSVDGGSWQPAVRQRTAHQTGAPAAEHFHSYWTPIPAGTQRVLLRGEGWWGGPWEARGVAIWALPRQPAARQGILPAWLNLGTWIAAIRAL